MITFPSTFYKALWNYFLLTSKKVVSDMNIAGINIWNLVTVKNKVKKLKVKLINYTREEFRAGGQHDFPVFGGIFT